jgi:hypothetical protein
MKKHLFPVTEMLALAAFPCILANWLRLTQPSKLQFFLCRMLMMVRVQFLSTCGTRRCSKYHKSFFGIHRVSSEPHRDQPPCSDHLQKICSLCMVASSHLPEPCSGVSSLWHHYVTSLTKFISDGLAIKSQENILSKLWLCVGSYSEPSAYNSQA